MTFLTVEAHDLNTKFENQIKRKYGVTVKERSNEPWCVVFEGSRESLIKMFNKHWGEDDPNQAIDSDSPWLSEEYKPTSNMPKALPKFDHAYTVAFTVSTNNAAETVTAQELRTAAMSQIEKMTDEELKSACGLPFDTVVHSEGDASVSIP